LWTHITEPTTIQVIDIDETAGFSHRFTPGCGEQFLSSRRTSISTTARLKFAVAERINGASAFPPDAIVLDVIILGGIVLRNE
jgi:hypothetical protein